MRYQVRAALLAGVVALALAGCNKAEAPAAPAATDIFAAAGSAGPEWLTYGGTYDEQRHSALRQIQADNLADLGVAWTYDLESNRGVETTPIIHDGVMYATASWSVLHAIDARTGKRLWVYDPGADKSVGVDACCDVVNRGVAWKDGVLFLGVIDGRLEAIDSKTGKRLWSVQTTDRSKPYTVTGAPRVVKNLVLIGNGGAELGVRGYVTAYDVKTGAKVWRFYTAPNPDKKPDGEVSDAAFQDFANASWSDSGRWKTDGGGGTVWDSIVYDVANDQVILGVGNGSPWNADLRDSGGKGDNLFVGSLVALDADTGKYKWHFQQTPRDNWDYTSTQTIILADLPLGANGAPRRVVMQAPKNGFYYVIDAATGKFISGKGYVPQTWTKGLDRNGRPIETAAARPTDKPSLLLPGPNGGHNWHPMAYDPDLKLAFIPAQEIPQAYAPEATPDRQTVWNTGFDFNSGMPADAPDLAMLKAMRAALKGRLIAWDPVHQRARWSVEQGMPGNGGVLSTAAGLVFQGTVGGDLVAYDAKTGKELWRHALKGGGIAPPVSYELDGQQYLAIATGWGGAYGLSAGYAFDPKVHGNLGRVIAFRLGAKGEIPDHQMTPIARTPQAAPFGDAAMLDRGLKLFSRNCMVCHGPMAISSGILPDLRWSPISGNADSWNQIVINGALAQNGMVSFRRVLSADDAEAIRAYVVQQANGAPKTATAPASGTSGGKAGDKAGG